ncbi:DUF6864 domain-containing function [Ancylomarina sp. YFZ004]
MWTIKRTKRDDSKKVLLSESTFCSLDQVLSFELSIDDNTHVPIEINFIVKKDKQQKKFLTHSSELTNRELTITYYNPGTGSSGPLKPLTILENDLYYFKVIHQTTMTANSETYLLTIEFFIQNK